MEPKKYLITSAQAAYTLNKDGDALPYGVKGNKRWAPKAKPHKQFLKGLETYAKENDYELVILPVAGKNTLENILHQDLDGRDEVFRGNLKRLNKNIQIRDLVVPPQNVDPTTGKASLVSKYNSSIIFPHPKQRFLPVPVFNADLPRYLYSTGAVTLPNYNTANHRGDTAERNHVFGALALEILDDKHFNLRPIKAKKNGKFVDLGLLYDGIKKPKEIGVDSMVIGDYHWANHDPQAVKSTYEMIEKFQPDRIFLHDFFDGQSVNRHETENILKRARQFKKGNLSLEKELNDLYKESWNLQSMMKKKGEIYVISSNHDAFLPKYINNGEWVKNDVWNADMASYLYRQSINLEREEEDIDDASYSLQKGLEKFGPLPENMKFLRLKDSFRRYGYQLASHGHLGARGSRGGNAKSREVTGGGKSITGHCFSEDTEILTKEGWKFGFELKKEDLVATMNQKTRLLEWQKINKFFSYEDYKDLVQIKSSKVDLLVTPGHGLFRVDHKNQLKKFTAINFKEQKGHINFITAIENTNKRFTKLTNEELRLLVWVLADGNIDSKIIRWNLKKERKIKRLTALLDSLKLGYSHNKNRDGTTRIGLRVKNSEKYIKILEGGKRMPDWFRESSKEECDLILEEYGHTDGTITHIRDKRIQLSSSKEREIDILQAMCTINGIRTSKLKRKKQKYFKKSWKDQFILSALYNHKTVRVYKENQKKAKYDGMVWCVNVDNGSLIARRNGHTVVTQNSHVMEIYGDTYIVGTNSKLNQSYTHGGGSASIAANAVLYKNGTVQMIPIIKGKWKANEQ